MARYMVAFGVGVALGLGVDRWLHLLSPLRLSITTRPVSGSVMGEVTYQVAARLDRAGNAAIEHRGLVLKN